MNHFRRQRDIKPFLRLRIDEGDSFQSHQGHVILSDRSFECAGAAYTCMTRPNPRSWSHFYSQLGTLKLLVGHQKGVGGTYTPYSVRSALFDPPGSASERGLKTLSLLLGTPVRPFLQLFVALEKREWLILQCKSFHIQTSVCTRQVM